MDDFLKKKKQLSEPKTMNIRMVQEALELATPTKNVCKSKALLNSATSMDSLSDDYLANIKHEAENSKDIKKGRAEKRKAGTKPTRNTRKSKRASEPCELKPKASLECFKKRILNDKSTGLLPDIAITSSTNEIPPILSGSEITNKQAIPIEQANTSKHTKADASEALKDRRMRIESFATRNINIPYSLINLDLYLPKEMKMIGQLFKILETTYKFNQKRNLSLVLIKYKDSIERLFKHRLDNKYLEQLNFIAGEYIEYLPVTLIDKGVAVKSVTVIIKPGGNIDKLLYDYFIGEYKRWTAEKGIVECTKAIHPDFKAEEVKLPRKKIVGVSEEEEAESKELVQTDGGTRATEAEKVKAKEVAGSIYERIKEKERLRREAFKNEQALSVDYEDKIRNIFSVGGKRSIKLSDLIFQFGGGFKCKDKILSSLKGKYYVKIFDGVEYIVKQTK